MTEIEQTRNLRKGKRKSEETGQNHGVKILRMSELANILRVQMGGFSRLG
jgi:hypothetical protein